MIDQLIRNHLIRSIAEKFGFCGVYGMGAKKRVLCEIGAETQVEKVRHRREGPKMRDF